MAQNCVVSNPLQSSPEWKLLPGLLLRRVSVLGLGLHRGGRGRRQIDPRESLVVYLVDEVQGLQDFLVSHVQSVMAVVVVLVGVGRRGRGVLGVVDLLGVREDWFTFLAEKLWLIFLTKSGGKSQLTTGCANCT